MTEHKPEYIDKKYRVDIEKIIEDKDIIIVDNRELGENIFGMSYKAGGYNVFSVCGKLNKKQRRYILGELYCWNKLFNGNKIIKKKNFKSENLFCSGDEREKEVVKNTAKLLIPRKGIYKKKANGTWPNVVEYAKHFDVTLGIMKTRLHLENIIYEE